MMRLRILHTFFIVLFTLLAAFSYYLQIIKGPLYKNLSYKNSIRLLNMPAPRGTICDRHGKVLAENILSFGVFIVPQEAKDIDEEIEKISTILGVSESLLKRNYKRNYHAPFAPVELIRNVSRTQAILIEESKLDMPGVMVKEIVVRNYPYKEALSHVIGYLGEIGTLELEFLKGYGYAAKDLIGKDGIERLMDGVLRGRNGGMQIQIDNRGCQVKVLSSKIATKGKDIYLTIDSDLQNFIWKMMENKRGAIIFMNPNNGEILSMVSSPSYDPNDSVAKVLFDEGSPLLNRAIMCQYPPGSVFKIIIALLGLESERLQPLTTFFCRGRLRVGRDEFYCWKEDGHGLMNLEDAIIHSCNNYFQNTGLLLGADRICEYAMHFGFGKKTCIELFGEIEGFVPSRMWKKAEMKEPWYAGDTANLSIGQGYLLATPLQVACMIASVANGGENVEPHLLKGVNNIEIKGHKNVKLRIKKENLDVVRKAMEGVVEEPDGTGFRAWSELVSISAKTGTAQVGGGLRPHAWFGGFAPSENPEVCFVVFLEHGGSGGDIAALVAKKAVEYWYKNH